MAVSADKNILIKEYNKLSKYKHLEIEIEKMRKLPMSTAHVIVVALGIIERRTNKKHKQDTWHF